MNASSIDRGEPSTPSVAHIAGWLPSVCRAPSPFQDRSGDHDIADELDAALDVVRCLLSELGISEQELTSEKPICFRSRESPMSALPADFFAKPVAEVDPEIFGAEHANVQPTAR